MIKRTPIGQGIEAIRAVVGRYRRNILRILTQPGRYDVYMSALVTALVISPMLSHPVAAQVGMNQAKKVLCSNETGINISQIITLGLGLISAYFILKFLFRLMTGLDKAGSTDSGAQQQGKQEAKGGVYSLLAALLPVLVPVFLKTAGINVANCLL